MTEYNLSPGSLDRYVEKQIEVAQWIDETRKHQPANPNRPLPEDRARTPNYHRQPTSPSPSSTQCPWMGVHHPNGPGPTPYTYAPQGSHGALEARIPTHFSWPQNAQNPNVLYPPPPGPIPAHPSPNFPPYAPNIPSSHYYPQAPSMGRYPDPGSPYHGSSPRPYTILPAQPLRRRSRSRGRSRSLSGSLSVGTSSGDSRNDDRRASHRRPRGRDGQKKRRGDDGRRPT